MQIGIILMDNKIKNVNENFIRKYVEISKETLLIRRLREESKEEIDTLLTMNEYNIETLDISDTITEEEDREIVTEFINMI